MKRILFVCESPPHPLHAAFAESIGADFFRLPGDTVGRIRSLFRISKDYDIYFSEGSFGYLYLLKLLRMIPRGAKTVNLFSDPRLYQLVEGTRFNFKKGVPERYPYFRKIFQLSAIRSLDGAICVGRFQSSLLKRIARIPVGEVRPFVRKEFFGIRTSDLKSNNILFIGGGPDYHYKGLDILIRVFRKLGGKSKLYIIGDGWKEYSRNVKDNNIVFLGRLEHKDVVRYMKGSSLYCHFGRGEAFGISVLEAMAAGIPCVVSDKTGAKEAVGSVSKRFVIPLSREKEMADAISGYLREPVRERLRIGRRFRDAASAYSEAENISLFKQEFIRLVKDITEGNGR